MKRVALICLIVLSGCGSNEDGKGAPTADTASAPASRTGAAPATAAPLSSIKPPGHAYADADVPVPSDYAADMEKGITEANYKEQLATLQSEVAAAMKAQGMKATGAAAHAHEHEHDGGKKHSHDHDHAHGDGHDHHGAGHGHEHTHDGGKKHSHDHDHAEGKGHTHKH